MTNKPTYFKDKEDELIYLEMLEDMDMVQAKNIYQNIKDTTPDKNVSGSVRNTNYKNLTYRNLRYLILGCEWCSAELRVKALATFIARSYTSDRFSALVTNEDLRRRLHDSIQTKLITLYKYSGIDYTDIEGSLN